MKKIGLLLIALLMFIPFTVNAKTDNSKLVKVYIFEAGGCPFCEKQVEYLKGLSSYNKKFQIVMKELYVDHIEWKQGKDFDLGVKVAKGFNAAGFEDASYQATPFVVISDIYAAASYSESLEDVINEAYEKGDKDIVSCYADGKDDCLPKVVTTDQDGETTTSKSTTTSSSTDVILIVVGSAMIIIYAIISTLNRKAIVEALDRISSKK